MSKTVCLVVSLALAAIVGSNVLAVADELPDLGEAARAELSPQLERRIGERIMNEIRSREPSYVDDADINDYLNRLGGRLVTASTNPLSECHFFAIRDGMINAFAMFGGFIGVNTGTILTAQSESELAGVLAHEISHVQQNHLARNLAREKQNSLAMMIAMAVGVLAARSNSQIANATIASAQAGAIQSQLAYSRDFEREADRVGFQTLRQAGFDVHGMGDFFGRLLQAGRVYDNSAPVYLRSHPLTLERISDMQNRAQDASYRQVADSLEFHLVRAKLRVQAGAPGEQVREFTNQLREKKYPSEAGVRYGLSYALLQAKDWSAAQREMDALLALKTNSPMIGRLHGEIRRAAGDSSGAIAVYRQALQRFPQSKSLIYGYAEAMLAGRQHEQALNFLSSQLAVHGNDDKLYALQAKTFAAAGKRLQQHRAQAEAYLLQGQLGAAVEQMTFAQQAGDGNFFEQSAVDARLRELKKLLADELKEKRAGNGI
ncbi:MAG TPA: M48 family metalloprotease [Accumulibacter sp.]|uniref:M48 family metalloprotease n=1 Tax=Accumulibacter sp. TaxID=2053492 RepID=UPI0028787E85|nr:M48 family metalloprotease [Accumulibacter sp.]MDS4055712.1 M48 family metalloprotease [Accumulibacter sp.]MDS4075415.1 M48 family metalloprotease [Accumulibacter sp.]HMW18178.1 M48 family metalloprotease [Accumulibacter sp.]HMX23529.1 M48 family metalloprotease [Accumulibacter sp.]HMY06726.1 M48 family metalloprotease [Accumulibacter sp.]